jgi:AcrR family transcriptional regulator
MGATRTAAPGTPGVVEVDGGAARRPGRPRDPVVELQIVTAAIDLVGEVGFDGLTMDEVARRAGVAKATVYRRFPSKVDLVMAVCHALTPAIGPEPDTGSIEEDLLVVMGGILDKLKAPDSGRLMPAMIATSVANPEIREALQRFSANRRERTTKIIKRAVARGELRDDIDVELMVDLLLAPLIYRNLISGRPVNAQVARRLVSQVLRGALADPS